MTKEGILRKASIQIDEDYSMREMAWEAYFREVIKDE